MSFIPDVGAIAPALLVAFVSAAILALVLTPGVRRFSKAFGLVDRPDPRRVNLRPIPRGGGIAVAAAFLTVAIVAVILVDRRAIPPLFIPVSVDPRGARAAHRRLASGRDRVPGRRAPHPRSLAARRPARRCALLRGRARGHGRHDRQPDRPGQIPLGNAFAVAFSVV
jgi:hypothetical protein